MILESIYEPLFHNSSHGFRPKRSWHAAVPLRVSEGRGRSGETVASTGAGRGI